MQINLHGWIKSTTDIETTHQHGEIHVLWYKRSDCQMQYFDKRDAFKCHELAAADMSI